MYKYTRQEVADMLSISTRSVDRYVKAGKLRAQKEGKVVYVSGDDVDNLMSGSTTKHEVIVEKKSTILQNSSSISTKNENFNGGLDSIYTDLREEIKDKDGIIRELSMRVGRAEEIAKQSVSLIDFKKSQFLLEESKGYLTKEVEDLRDDNGKLNKDLKYEKTSNIILIVFVILLLLIAGGIWFMKI